MIRYSIRFTWFLVCRISLKLSHCTWSGPLTLVRALPVTQWKCLKTQSIFSEPNLFNRNSKQASEPYEGLSKERNRENEKIYKYIRITFNGIKYSAWDAIDCKSVVRSYTIRCKEQLINKQNSVRSLNNVSVRCRHTINMCMFADQPYLPRTNKKSLTKTSKTTDTQTHQLNIFTTPETKNKRSENEIMFHYGMFER